MSFPLDPDQQSAVESTARVTAVVAGPGTGKTHTLTVRIAHLLDSGVDPQKILALTFTTKAAQEIKDRLNNPSLSVHTFHSLAYSFLTPSPKIIDEVTQYQIIKKLVAKNVAKTLLAISRFKSGMEVEESVKFIVDLYNQELSRLGILDYDDLLLRLLDHIRENPLNFDHVLIDEFQDTNQVQYQLICAYLDSNPCKSLFVIGDPRQSIYAFRGANARVFDQFVADFSPQIINLTTNYRSCPEIIKTAQLLFPQDQPLTCSFSAGVVQTVKCCGPYSQASWILNFINQKFGGFDLNSATSVPENHHFSDFAILYRRHRDATILKKKFFDSGIPYQASSDDSQVGVLDPSADRVILSTIHAAKGLEFKYVFIYDFDNYTIDSDEDRRLLYVALTRAKQELYFLWSLHLPVFFPGIQKHIVSITDDQLSPDSHRLRLRRLKKSQIPLF